MTAEERNKAIVIRVFEEAFGKGNLAVIDEVLASNAVDHQETPGTDFAEHLKDVVRKMRAAFPDLHFDIHHILAEGEIVAVHSTMTGTHRGRFEIGPFAHVEPAGRRIAVRHMHFLRWVDGKNTDLWHVWDTPTLMRQLGADPQRTGVPA